MLVALGSVSAAYSNEKQGSNRDYSNQQSAGNDGYAKQGPDAGSDAYGDEGSVIR